MKRIVLIALVSLYGTSVLAMKVHDLKAVLATKDDAQIKAMVEDFKSRRTDIDRYGTSGRPYAADLNACKAADLSLASIVDGIFAELQPHRSNPPDADELRKLLNPFVVGKLLDLNAIEKFLENKCLNIDLILLDPKYTETIGSILESVRDRDDVKAVLRLERIREFRYESNLKTALLAKDDVHIKAIVQDIKDSRIDIDRCGTLRGTYASDLNESKAADPSLAGIVDGIFAELQPHRSNPEKADELRRLLNPFDTSGHANVLDPSAVEQFLKDTCLNIDLILLDPKDTATIGSALDGARNRDDVKEVLRLERIKEFRYVDDSLVLLNELIEEVLADALQFTHFEAHIIDMLVKKKSVDVDSLKVSVGSVKTCGEILDEFVGYSSKGAVLMAECVQPHRSHQDATIRALFKAFEKHARGAKNVMSVEYLTQWIKKYSIDFAGVPYDAHVPTGDKLSTKLDELLADAATKDDALPIARLARPWRSDEMKTFSDLLDAYKADKTNPTNLKNLKDWFDAHIFDIDSALSDTKVLTSKTYGDIIDELKDPAISSIFSAKRSKIDKPPKSQSDPLKPQPKKSYFTPLNIGIVLAVLTVIYLRSTTKTQNTSDKNTEPTPTNVRVLQG